MDKRKHNIGGELVVLGLMLLATFFIGGKPFEIYQTMTAEAAACPISDGGVGDDDSTVDGVVTISSSKTFTAITGSYDCTQTPFLITGTGTLVLDGNPATGQIAQVSFGTLTVNSGGVIHSNAEGCIGDTDPGNGPTSVTVNTCVNNSGLGNGAGGGGGGNTAGGGAGHGGAGGYSSNNALGGEIYGSATVPVLFGASGGGSGSAVGGSGGGVVRITVTGTFTHNGTISANGSGGTTAGSGQAAGGGAGGSVYVTAGTLNGTTGTFSANGGNGADNGTSNPDVTAEGGGGGAGRIAVYQGGGSFSFDASDFTVTGGTAADTAIAGANGTVFVKNTVSNAVTIFHGFTYDDTDHFVSSWTVDASTANQYCDTLLASTATPSVHTTGAITLAGSFICLPGASTAGTGTLSNTGTAVTGVGTTFHTQLSVGSAIIVAGQTRFVTSISSPTTLTIDTPFSPSVSALGFRYNATTTTSMTFDAATTLTLSANTSLKAAAAMLISAGASLVTGTGVAISTTKVNADLELNVPAATSQTWDNMTVNVAPEGEFIIDDVFGLTLQNGTTINASVRWTALSSLTENAGTLINANAKGCYYDKDTGNGPTSVSSNLCINNSGLGVGAQGGGGGNTAGAGSGHGGVGGNSSSGAIAGSSYGSAVVPSLFGGSGGGSGSADGGAGGGVVRIVVSGAFVHNGTISANAGNGLAGTSGQAGGGGAGGSVYVTAGTLNGTTGTFSANGGNGGVNTGNGGGGGAGRIAVYHGGGSFPFDSGDFTVTGGTASGTAVAGGGGTVFVKNTSTNAVSIYHGFTYDDTDHFASSWTIDASVTNQYCDPALTATATPSVHTSGAITLGGSLACVPGTTTAGTGTISSTGAVVTGTGTTFHSQLFVGDAIIVAGQTRFVTSISSATSLTVDVAFSPSLSAASFRYNSNTITSMTFDATTTLTLPASSSVKIAGALLLSAGGTFATGTGVIVSTHKTNADLEFNVPVGTSQTWDGMTVNVGPEGEFISDDAYGLTLQNGTIVNGSVRWTGLTSLTQNAGTFINANARGCLSDKDTGNGVTNATTNSCNNNSGLGVGAQGGGGGTTAGAGSAHAGAGGNSTSGAIGGTTYGSATTPSLFGASGGGSGSADGGSGGGAVRISVSGTYTNNGIISANGASGLSGTSNQAGGGGAGGSIYVTAGTLNGSNTGAGTVTTSGTTTLTGVGTAFTTTLAVGSTIFVQGETARVVASIASNTSLTVTSAFSTSVSGLTYSFASFSANGGNGAANTANGGGGGAGRIAVYRGGGSFSLDSTDFTVTGGTATSAAVSGGNGTVFTKNTTANAVTIFHGFTYDDTDHFVSSWTVDSSAANQACDSGLVATSTPSIHTTGAITLSGDFICVPGATTAGTGTVSSSGTTVTGTSTTFTSQLLVGDAIYAAGQIRFVTSITSATSLTTDAAFSPALSTASFRYNTQTISSITFDAGTALTLSANSSMKIRGATFLSAGTAFSIGTGVTISLTKVNTDLDLNVPASPAQTWDSLTVNVASEGEFITDDAFGLTLQNGTVINASVRWTALTALTQNSGTSINATAKGCFGDLNTGNGVTNATTNTCNDNSGLGIGASGGGGGNAGGGGSGHGGAGGASSSGAAGGAAYDSLTAPILFGGSGGGGGGAGSNGGSGGGLIRIVVNGTLTHNGTISAGGGNGQVGTSGQAGGGGAGGGIYLTSSTYTCSTGTFAAKGGNGADNTGDGGGGGGGRFSIEYGTDSSGACPLSGLTAAAVSTGGTVTGTAVAGANGTINLTTPVPTAGACPFVDNDAGDADATVGVYEWNADQTFTASATTYNCTSPATFRIVSGRTITLDGVDASGLFASVNFTNLIINSTGALSANTEGCVGATGAGRGPNATTNICAASVTGFGTTGAGGANTAGGGAGFGGIGGASSSAMAGGVTYGSAIAPVLFGSSGGGANEAAVGGAGGGVVKVTVNGALTNNGTISANAGAGVAGTSGRATGGGSGGSIFIQAGTINGTTGTFEAKGGNGGNNTGDGGGGGGGRIAIFYNATGSSFSFSSTNVLVTAGTATDTAVAGAKGTIYVNDDNGTKSAPTDDDITIFHGFSINDIDYMASTWTVDPSATNQYCETGIGGTATPSVTATGITLAGTLSCTQSLASVDYYASGTFTLAASTSFTVNAPLSFGGGAGFTINSNVTITDNASNADIDFNIPAGINQTWNNLTVNIPTEADLTVDDAVAITLSSGTTLNGNVKFTNLTAFTQDFGTTINANASGCIGTTGAGRGPNATTNICAASTTGFGTNGSNPNTAGGGASHGGTGGFSSSFAPNGAVYGSAVAPVLYGSSGGGANDAAFSGAGGGLVRIAATGTVTLNGTITADGGAGAVGTSGRTTGGGSGGSIYISTNGSLTGSITSFSAKGGNGADSIGDSGGAGGGRIALVYGSTTLTPAAGLFAVDGGTATDMTAPGLNGTVYVDDMASTPNSTGDDTVRIFHGFTYSDTDHIVSNWIVDTGATNQGCDPLMATTATPSVIASGIVTLGGTLNCLSAVPVQAGNILSSGTTVTGTATTFTSLSAGDAIIAGNQTRFITAVASSTSLTIDVPFSPSLSSSSQAGTGTISSSGTTVTGVGTSFTTIHFVGDTITAAGQTRTITAIASATSLTTDTAFSPAIPASTAFTFVRNKPFSVNTASFTSLTFQTNGTLSYPASSTMRVAGGLSGTASTLTVGNSSRISSRGAMPLSASSSFSMGTGVTVSDFATNTDIDFNIPNANDQTWSGLTVNVPQEGDFTVDDIIAITLSSGTALNGSVKLTNLTTFTQNTGTSINANFGGCMGATGAGRGPAVATNICAASTTGFGTTGSGSANTSGGGGGYGGTGGASSSQVPGGATYGSASAPVLYGSSGGGANVSVLGGAGGGLVRINATGTVTLNGTITADGGAGVASTSGAGQATGGGSGGSIYISTNGSLTGSLNGPGTVTTNGTTTLTGVGTSFTTNFTVGSTISVQGETARTIASIASNTSLTVTSAFSTSASGLTYLAPFSAKGGNGGDNVADGGAGGGGRIALSYGSTTLPLSAGLFIVDAGVAVDTGVPGQKGTVFVDETGVNKLVFNDDTIRLYHGFTYADVDWFVTSWLVDSSTDQNCDPAMSTTATPSVTATGAISLAGALNCTTTIPVQAGTISSTGTTVTGHATIFTTYSPGDAIVSAGQTRFITAVASNTSLTIDAPFSPGISSASQAGTGTISSSGTTVTGTGTSFNTLLFIGDHITASGQTRTITAIGSATSLTTDTAFSPAITGGTSFTFVRNRTFSVNSANITNIAFSTPVAASFPTSSLMRIAGGLSVTAGPLTIGDSVKLLSRGAMPLSASSSFSMGTGVTIGDYLNNTDIDFNIPANNDQTWNGLTVYLPTEGDLTVDDSIAITLASGTAINGSVKFSNLTTFTQNSGTSINANAGGCAGATGAGRGPNVSTNVCTASVAGYGQTGSGGANSAGGGGGYGSLGGASSSQVAGGVTNGSATAPNIYGSSGGGSNLTGLLGGAGGGLVRINATGTVTLNGTITADGGAGSTGGTGQASGGGSGGSIYITTNGSLTGSLNGPGTVTTNGTTTLTGVGTAFTTNFTVGSTISVQGETARTIASIASNTSLTVTSAFSTSASGLTYLAPFSAKGGNGGDSVSDGGGGSGGRIALSYGSTTLPLSAGLFIVDAGTAPDAGVPGQKGTVYAQDTVNSAGVTTDDIINIYHGFTYADVDFNVASWNIDDSTVNQNCDPLMTAGGTPSVTVSGPITLGGSLNCTTTQPVIAGTISSTGTTVTGNATTFTSYGPGDAIIVAGQTRFITAVASNTSVTIDAPFSPGISGPSQSGTGTISSSGTTVTGTGTAFTTTLFVGDHITASGQTRTITAIASATSLTTDTAFSPVITGGTSFTFVRNRTYAINTASLTNLAFISPATLTYPANAVMRVAGGLNVTASTLSIGNSSVLLSRGAMPLSASSSFSMGTGVTVSDYKDNTDIDFNIPSGNSQTWSGLTVNVAQEGDLTVDDSVAITLSSGTAINGNVKFTNLTSFTQDLGTSINANAKGCTGVTGAGRGPNSSNVCAASGAGFGQTGAGGANSSGGGGGHGGFGGASSSLVAGGTIYDSATAPVLYGSAGGGANVTLLLGGAGGGLVRINASGTVTLNGTVSADGGVGSTGGTGNASGGGSGGSIYVTAGTLAGSIASFSAKGGNGGDSVGDGSGAGGGRIALVFSSSTMTFGTSLFDVAGGTAPDAGVPGQKGTVYVNNIAANTVNVYHGFTYANTDFNVASWNVDASATNQSCDPAMVAGNTPSVTATGAITLAGTLNCTTTLPAVAGTISSTGTTVTGNATVFTGLSVGDALVVNGQTRFITAIASNTSLTIDSAFSPGISGPSQSGTGTISSSGTTVTGTGTAFTTTLFVGDHITASGQTRTITAIASATSLTTDTAFSPVITGGTSFTFVRNRTYAVNSASIASLAFTTPGTISHPAGTAMRVAGGISESAGTLSIGNSVSLLSRGAMPLSASTSFATGTSDIIGDFANNTDIDFNVPPGIAQTWDSLTVIVPPEGDLTMDDNVDLTLQNGTTINGSVKFTNLVNFTQNSGTSINANFKGCIGATGAGRGPALVTNVCAGSTTGYGLTGSGAANTAGGGAGHGGAGGASSSAAAGGTTYDAAASPILYGSSGGGANVTGLFGGAGGGQVRITASGTFTHNGTIAADGGAGAAVGTQASGGGSGGSINIATTTYTCSTGTFSAKGGNGGDNTGDGGGGGGGRMAVSYNTDSVSCPLSGLTAAGVVTGGSATGTAVAGATGSLSLNLGNPVPAISLTTPFSPANKAVGSSTFTLTVNGSNFISGSIVRFNGVDKTTGFTSATVLTATIPNTDLAVAGSYPVTVFNPTPAGGESNTVYFDVTNPLPTTTSISPTNKNVGDGTFTMTVNGTNFVAASVVRFAGSDRTTTFVNSGQVTASIPASDMLVGGNFNITVFNAGPGGGTSNAQTFTVGNPIPTTTGISPTSKPMNDPAFTLTVDGTNFVSTSVVRFAGSDRTTTFVSSTQLTADIPASDLLVGGTFNITVFNPTPGGGTSNAQTFTVTNPVPTTTTISPTSKNAGQATFTLTVNGSNFISTSVVRFNGTDRTTTFVNATQLTASITAANIVTGGEYLITVFNGTPGGGTSNAQTLTVNNLVPTTTSISPSTRSANSGNFTLIVNGTNFVSTSVVRFAGVDRTTSFVNSGRVDASIPNSDIAANGTYAITVFNPTPGGGESNSQTLTVQNPVPTTTSISPTAKDPGSADFTLTVNGTNFVPSSVVRFAGSDRTTAFVSTTQLTADIPSTDLVSAGTFLITVFNPAPSGGTSNSQNFIVGNPIPVNTSISPNTKNVNDATFTLTVNGSDFITSSVVRFAGSDRTTTFVSANQITASIPASDLTTAGTFNITVFNPTPGGGTSVSRTLTVNNPVPVTTSISPTTKNVGDLAFTMTVNGSNFMPTSVVKFNGSSRTTTYVNANQLTASILTSDLTTAGSIPIIVTNPTPGGGDSNSQTFTINNLVPSTSSIAPTTVASGSGGITLTVNGNNFVSTSVVRWNGADRTTTFIAATQLTASIPSSDLTTSGTFTVTVFNPAPGGGTSNGQTFTVGVAAAQTPTSTNKVTLSRLKSGAVSTVDIAFTLASSISGPLTVTFPSGFTVTAAATGGSACLGSFGFTSSTLTAVKTNCSGAVSMTGGTVQNPSTPGVYFISWVNDAPGGGSVIITDSDQSSISASIDPAITFNVGSQPAATACDGAFSGNGGSVPLGVLTSVSSSDAAGVPHVCARLTSDASSGAVVSVRSLNAGLRSAAVPADIIVSSTATLSAGTAGYGLCVGSAGADSGKTDPGGGPASAAPTRAAPFNGTCTSTDHNVGGLTTSLQNAWSVSGPSLNAYARIYLKAALGLTTAAHNDYADTLTFVVTGTY